MISPKLTAILLSIMLHVGIVCYFLYVPQPSPTQQNQALIDSPVISIALTQAVQETQPDITPVSQEASNKPLIDTPAIVKHAAIIIPKKSQKIEKKIKDPMENKLATTMNKKNSTQKELTKLSSQKSELIQQKKMGDNLSSPSAGAIGYPTKPVSGNSNNQLINAYREKLRQEVERNKQYPRRAKKMKNTGIVKIQFKLNNMGDITSAQLVGSSGNTLLDNAALSAVEKSRSVGEPPVGFAQSITLNIEFN